MNKDRFEELVGEALEGLPQKFKDSLENVVVIVQDWPTREQLADVGLKRKHDLLGLYEGVPLPDRGTGYNMVLPDRITIFQRPIEIDSRSEQQIIRQVQETVRHEIAHHFGISDRRLLELENL